MRGILVVLAILAVFSAILIHQLHKRLFGLPVPDGLNPNSTFSFQVVGFLFNFAKDLSYLGSRLGIVNNYHVSIRNIISTFAHLTLNQSFGDQIEINDTEIFGSKVRIYKPVNNTKDDNEVKVGDEEEEQKLMPAVIYYHGGGWTIGSLDAYDAFCRRLAVTAQVIVVSADYVQAPEYLYPMAFNQCYNVAVGLLNNGTQYGVDVKRIMVAGDSAGGNLAAAVTHTVAYVGEKHCKKQYIAGQILIYPSLQLLNFSLPSYLENEDGVLLSRRDVVEFASMYLTGNTDMVDAMLAGKHSKHLENSTYMSYFVPEESEDPSKGEENVQPYIDEEELFIEDQTIAKPLIEMTDLAAQALINIKGSPLLARHFRGVPQTFLLTAEVDPLRDEEFLYANRLKKAGVDVIHKHYPSFHGFVTVTSEPWPYGTVEAAEAIRDIATFINRMKKTEDEEQEEQELDEREE